MKAQTTCDSCRQQNAKWVYLEKPVDLECFGYKTKNETIIRFDQAIPHNTMVRKAKLILFLRTGYEDNVTFYTKVRVIDGDDEFVHWTYGHRYPQNAISYNSETIEIPCLKTR